MKFDFSADVIGSELLVILLKDRTTEKNIIWATNDYKEFGEDYFERQEITAKNFSVIQPNILKNSGKKKNRVRDKAEIFTPSWLCNEQNNLIDEAWFGRANVFNRIIDEQRNCRESPSEKIFFEGEKTWQSYVEANRLEITCGEAPYLVSRYDTTSGESIPLENRIGLLDRKLRVVNENTDIKKDWIEWAKKAVQSVYGYEFQGDNLFLARKNIFFTYVENYKKQFEENPDQIILEEIAEIISWNLWQMDGLTNKIPYAVAEQNLFDKNSDEKISCQIMDWKKNQAVLFESLLKGGLK